MFSVHQHWDPLKVCAVGRSYPPEFYSYIKDARVRNVFEKIAQETEEDYQKLISKLEEFGVEVLRTDIAEDLDVYRRDTSINMPASEIPAPPMTPRDFTAMVGSTFHMPGESYANDIRPDWELEKILCDESVAETYTRFKNTPELGAYIQDLFLPGRAVDMTPSTVMKIKNVVKNVDPSLRRFITAIDTEDLRELIIQSKTNTIGSNNKFPNFKKFYAFESIRNRLLEEGNTIAYDTYINSAMMTRVGKDLFHSLGNIINFLDKDRCGEQWKTFFPDYRNHAVALPGHGDGGFCPVKPGLIVSLAKPKNYKDTFPGWEVVHLQNQSWMAVRPHMINKDKQRSRYFVPGQESNDAFHDYIAEWYDHWVTYVEETVFDVNMLVIDEQNVICNNENEQVFEAFERHGITPHVINFRHRYFWDGGLHCITSDLHRDGTRKDYFPDREVDQQYTKSTK